MGQRVQVEGARALVQVCPVAQGRAGPVSAPQAAARPHVVLAGAGVGGEGAARGDGLQEQEDGAVVTARHGVLRVWGGGGGGGGGCTIKQLKK